MGPLSAVAVAFFLGLFGGDQAQWWSVRPTILGIIAIVALAHDVFIPAGSPALIFVQRLAPADEFYPVLERGLHGI